MSLLQISYLQNTDQNTNQETPNLEPFLPSSKFHLQHLDSVDQLRQLLATPSTAPDCLILAANSLEYSSDRPSPHLLVPVVVLGSLHILGSRLPSPPVVHLDPDSLEQLPQAIESAIANFLELSPYHFCDLDSQPQSDFAESLRISLSIKQKRLAEKLEERLGYLGIYSKRNPEQFLRNLSEGQRKAYLTQLKQIYQRIILKYFKENPSNQELSINDEIDHLANLAFLGDVSASQILEIHMQLMDEYSKKLKLEGRNLDILLDYRITLIDVIAHLCEMYRRSVLRESKLRSNG
ncbi:MAG: KaiA family protein [Pseudanabaenaceae cyanobacterium bins.68]|nr:KaiA family protein [Pseudanabaenaceae cyanobacterium bins.68]